MFILLSSGASSRYRQDIQRAIAIPKGGRLQFRYDSRWIAANVLDLISKEGVKGTLCLITYVDQHDTTKTPELIPCRFATLVDVRSHGSTVSIILALEEFGYAEDLDLFNKEMRLASHTFPNWGEGGSINGTYWNDITQESKTVLRSSTLTIWEKIVAQISVRFDFIGESYFYFVEGLYPVGEDSPISTNESGSYELTAGRQYELRIYHFHPKKIPEQTWLRFATSSELLQFTTNPFMSIDSRYDMKRVRFKAGKPEKQEDTIFSIYRITSNRQDEFGKWEFDLPFQIKGSFWPNFCFGIIIGILLASPQIVAAFYDPNLSARRVVGVSIVAAILGLGTGLLASFKLRKPI